MLKQEVLKVFYEKNYNWQPLVYDSYKAWTYVFGRAAKEYAAIKQVFNEIEKRDPEFQPRSFFDFGAGIGTGAWAAAQNWSNTLYEYFLVDESRDMNDLSELILRDGNENKNMSLKNVFFRQFLPASDEVNYWEYYPEKEKNFEQFHFRILFSRIPFFIWNRLYFWIRFMMLSWKWTPE